MRILAIISGEYGARHVRNLREHGPASWQIEVWQAPTFFPLVIDYPEDYLPKELPSADLILSFAEHKGVAELLPDVAKMTGAQAVIAAVDNEAWLPRGLARQLRGWLERMNVVCVTPKPLCSLTGHDYGVTRRQRISYESALISDFATYFGQPQLAITVDPETRLISSITVKRDAVCGCARFVAENLVGISVDEAEEKAGLLHHHYPCLASMGKDSDFGDTLMHVSGNVLKDNVGEQVKPYKRVQYIAPGAMSETGSA
jgi:thymidylate synthase